MVLAIIGLATVSSAETAGLDYIYDHYSTDNGLPHNSICDIHQDQHGYIWICTWYGLSRFDGVRFVNYTLLPEEFSSGAHNRMLYMDEDVNGYLWIKTYDNRLARFDPVAEEFVAVPDGLKPFQGADLKITQFLFDSGGDAWIALHGRGLYRVTPDLEVIPILKNGVDILGNDITGLYEDSRGTVYAVSELGIATVRDDVPELISRSDVIRAFCEFGGKVYIAADKDVLVIDHERGMLPKMEVSEEITAITVSGSGDNACLYLGLRGGAIAPVDTLAMSYDAKSYDMGRVRYLFPDSQGLLWIATDRTGIYSYNPKTRGFRRYIHSRNVTSYYTDTLANVVEKAGMTWVKMNDYGFGWYDRENDAIVPMSNVKEQEDYRFLNGVACFEVDSNGVLWMSTARRGLERISMINPKVDIVVPPTLSKENLAASEIRAIHRDSRGAVWVAAKSRELYRYNSDMTRCERIPEDLGLVYSIFEDSDGNMWFGSKGDGLTKMTLRPDGSYSLRRFRHNPADKSSLSSDNIYSIAQDNYGKIWIGTFRGGISMLETPDDESFLNVYNNFPNYPVDYGERVRYVHCLPNGYMLISTIGGLFICDPGTMPESMVFKKLNEVPLDDIIHIFTDEQGRTFLSTFGGGLFVLVFDGDKVSSSQAVDMSKGLASNMVYSAAEDRNGDLWIATGMGISKVDHSSGAIVNFSRYDGIVPTTFSEATVEALEDGDILFGSLNNVYRLSPDDFGPTVENPRLVISGFSINGKRVPAGGTIVVPHNYSYFRVDYASLNFRIRGSLSLSYMLKGYEKDWITSTVGNSVTYSRIPAGKYRFIVTEGLDGGESAFVDIRVRSSIWSCTVAKLLYILIALGICVIVFRMVYTSARLRNKVQVEKDLNDVKMRFFTNISHELRTPLTLILGGIDEISRSTPKGDKNEYSVSLVHKNAKRMMLLVNQLLDIRSIANGKIRLKVQQIDIVELTKEVYNDFKDMASERQMETRLTYSVDSLMIWGDRMRLEALIYNLLSNAFKYTADGGCIEVAVLWREGDKEFSIMVKDNGIGVPKDKQTAIFEPFIKAADSTFNGMNSSGIGLSFCKDIADMHGGTIWVESTKGKGSEFWVKLPVERDHFSDETAEFLEVNAQAASEETYGLSKYKVEPTHLADAPKLLVVEDNAELRIFMYNKLVSRFEVRDASNGAEALQIIQDGWIPDMIITDLMMPQMDGIELTSRIRNDFATSHIPIIMCTAKHETDTQLKAVKYGADVYITKPFTVELLMARIDSLFGSRSRIVQNMAQAQETGTGQEAGTQTKKITLAPEEVVITDRDEEFINKVHQWLEENVADSEITVDQLASYVGMGRTSMYNKIKGLTGKSPVELIQEFRLEKAMFYLKSGQYSVSETSYKVGFSDPGYFSRSFKKHCGISPNDYIKENKKAR